MALVTLIQRPQRLTTRGRADSAILKDGGEHGTGIRTLLITLAVDTDVFPVRGVSNHPRPS